MRKTPRLLVALILSAVAVVAAGQSADEPFLSKRLQLVVPFAVGNGIDQLTREYAEILRTQLNTTVVVENRDGAGGIIGATFVSRAPADGNTVMMTAHPPFAIASQIQSSPAYDPLTSFMPVVRVGAVPLVLVTSGSSPFNDFQGMAAFMKANPDKSNYAASGVGSPGQLFTHQMKQATGLPMQEILYKSTAQALTDVISGVVLVSMISLPAAAPHLKSGGLKMLAVGSPERLRQFPDTPTLAAMTGLPGFEASVWYGVLVPAGTPPDRVNRLHAEIAKATTSPRMVEFMNRTGILPNVLGPDAFAASLKNDALTARKLIDSAKLKQQ